MKKQIVIIGGGFGGLTVASRIAKSNKRVDGCQVTLIDKQAKHLYFPLVYEVATGFFDGKDFNAAQIRHGEEELKAGASIPFGDLESMWRKKGVLYRYGDVVGIDWGMKAVILASGQKIPYDKLILATGSVVNTFGIPGLEQHAHMLYSLRGALSIRRKLHTLVEKRRRNEIPFIRIVVGGAGPTGVEFACEVALLLNGLVRKKILKWSDFSITVIDAADRPVRNFHKTMSKWVLQRFETLNIRFLSNTLIKGTHEDHIIIASTELPEGEQPETLLQQPSREKEINHEILVWTGGSKANPILADFGLPLNNRGKVEVDMTMQVRGQDSVWALGDCTTMKDPKTGVLVPPLAQAAIHQGNLVAKNIIASCNSKSLYPYTFPKMGAIVPLGGSHCVANLFGLKVRGPFIYLLKIFAEGRYFFKTLPFPIAWRIFWTALKAYRKNN